MTVAYPLQWPDAFPRSRSRETGRFKTSLAAALKNVETSLKLFGHDSGKRLVDVVLSSNVTLGTSKPNDPGIAVWFKWDDMQVCIPVDRYSTPEANLQAIHHVIEARRVELRHGTLSLVRATMKGFLALPTATNKRQWWEILKVERRATESQITQAYRDLAAKNHPDHGGSANQMAEINAARDEGLKEAKSR